MNDPIDCDLAALEPSGFSGQLAALRPRMKAVAMRFTRTPEAAEDVVQNACEKALRHVAGFRGNATFATWLHRIVVNEALMWLRRERRREQPTDKLEEFDPRTGPPGSAEPESPEAIASRRQRARRLHRGLAHLPREEREVLVECALGGASYRQFSHRHGVHPTTVKTRAYRGRRKLASLLEI